MLYESRPRLKDVDIQVLSERVSEGEYRVEFSNRGDKAHDNPLPANIKRQKSFPCVMGDDPIIQCTGTSKNKDGLCPLHVPKAFGKRVVRRHWADWIGRIVTPGRGRDDCVAWAPAHGKMTDILIGWADKDPKRCKAVDDFVFAIMRDLKGQVPDSTTLQHEVESGKEDSVNQIVEKALKAIEACFPSKDYTGITTNGGGYKHKGDPKVKLTNLPIRVAAGVLYLGIVSEEANRSDLWGYTKAGKPGSSGRASVFMPLDYYFLIAYLGATKKQAAQSVRH